MDGWIIHGFLIIVHGQRLWTTSLSSIHGQLPWKIILSSKGDMVSYKSYSRSNNISQSPWVVPDPICSPKHGRSLWTNWRWTNFSPSYQLPLRSKGRPGYWCNLKLIYMGLNEPRVAKSLVDFLSSSRLPKNATRQFLSGVPRFTDTVALITFSDGIATYHSLNGWRRFVVPTSGPYI